MPTMQAVDLPTYLSTVPDRPVQLSDSCPHCGSHELVGLYELGTNATTGIGCAACHWNEEFGCAGARCGSDECWAARQEPGSKCCSEPVVSGYCNGCGEST